MMILPFIADYTSPPEEGELPPPPHDPEPPPPPPHDPEPPGPGEEPPLEFLLRMTSRNKKRPSKRKAVEKKFSLLRAATIALTTSHPTITINPSMTMRIAFG